MAKDSPGGITKEQHRELCRLMRVVGKAEREIAHATYHVPYDYSAVKAAAKAVVAAENAFYEYSSSLVDWSEDGAS